MSPPPPPAPRPSDASPQPLEPALEQDIVPMEAEELASMGPITTDLKSAQPKLAESVAAGADQRASGGLSGHGGGSAHGGASDKPHKLGVLRHTHFRNIWFAALGSNVGNWMEVVGVQWTMAHLTMSEAWKQDNLPGAPIMMGWLAVAQFVPTVLLGLYGGLIADRVNRRTLLIYSQLMLALVATTLTILTAMDLINPWMLMVIGAANGVIMAFNIPAWQVLTPRLVPREDLAAAINMNGVQFNLSRVIGPALAGMMLGLTSPAVLFAVNALSFLGVVAVVATTPDAPAPPRTTDKPWSQIWKAMRFAFTTRGPAHLIIITTLFSMLGTPLLRMLPILVVKVYGKEESAYGSLLSIMGAGAVLGGLSLRYFPKWYPKHHFTPLSVAMGGITLVGFAAADSVTAAAVMIFFCGIFWMWSFNPAFAALQLLVPDDMRGRVLSIASTLSFGAMPVGALAAGGIAHLVVGDSDNGFGVQVGLGVLAMLLAVVGVVTLIWRTPEIDGLKPGDPGYERRPGLWKGITASGHRPAKPTEETMV